MGPTMVLCTVLIPMKRNLSKLIPTSQMNKVRNGYKFSAPDYS